MKINSSGSCECGDDPSKEVGLKIAEQLLASREQLCSNFSRSQFSYADGLFLTNI